MTDLPQQPPDRRPRPSILARARRRLRESGTERAARGDAVGTLLIMAYIARREGFPGIRRAVRTVLVTRRDYSLAVPFRHAIAAPSSVPSVAVACHIYHDELMPLLGGYLRNIPFRCPLFVTTDTPAKKAAIERYFADWTNGPVEVRLAPNRGRDIAPKLVALADVHDRFEYVLHVHAKRSMHHPRLHRWSEFLFNNLLGSPQIVASIFEIFHRFPGIGLVSSQHFEPLRSGLGWGENFALAEKLAGRMGISLAPDQAFDFPSGSMFWARTRALRPLLDLRLGVDDFPPELGQLDGTLAHAIERIYYFVCERAGFDWVKVARPDQFATSRRIAPIDSADALAAFIDRRLVRLTKGQPRA